MKSFKVLLKRQHADSFCRTILSNNSFPLIRNALSRTYFGYNLDSVHPDPHKKTNWLTPEQAVGSIKSNAKIFVQGIAATPTSLLTSLCHHAKEKDLKNINLYHMHLEGPAPWVLPEFGGRIRSNCLFISANLRKAIAEGLSDCIPIFLYETPWLFRRNVVNLDVAFIHVSPPDKKGFCTLGTSVDCTLAAIQNAKLKIALVNPNMPRTWGDGIVHMSHLDIMVHESCELFNRHDTVIGEAEKKIAQLVANNLVENGATLQMGIGSIPDAVLDALKGHRDLGIHTEMFSDGVLPLYEAGCITNAKKKIRPGKLVSSFALGSKALYEFMHDNPMIIMGDVGWVNDPAIIRQNPKTTAINSCIEIDLTGQVVSDSIGTRMYSGFGGQVDFLRGAAISNDMEGKAILALPSVTKRNESKIVPCLKQGAGVVTTRALVRFIVTEHGYADLFGKNFSQRAYELIRIAHPDHRQALEKAAFERFKCMPTKAT